MDGSWQWAAFGKHPVAKDFFRLGHFGPLEKNFSQWVDRGYRLLSARKKGPFCSWRFWTRGTGTEMLGCGVVRDCFDQLSRPYPLLIMGTGVLAGWEDQWDLNPLACERTWTQMEYLFTKNFSDLRQMEEEIGKILPPLGRWAELDRTRRDLLESAAGEPGEVERRLAPFSQGDEAYVPLDQGLFPDPSAAIPFLHSFFRREERAAPQSVFMGGTLEKALLAIFKRPLQPADFVRLWSVSDGGGN